MDKPIHSFDWGLDLPSRPVARRVGNHIRPSAPEGEPVVLAELKGPGCIRQIWMTGRNLGRDVILRIYFDGHLIPHVEAPLADFFGILHNLRYYPINTPYMAVKPKHGYNCYLPMPFAESARVEIEQTDRRARMELAEEQHPRQLDIHYLIDWHQYPGQKMDEPMRFSARWRRESPVADWGNGFLMLDADGPGRLVGWFLGIDMLESRQTHRWSHAGADNLYIDGDARHPSLIRGSGGEDTFGTAYSGGDYEPRSTLFADMPFYEQKDSEGDRQKVVGYRFHPHDAIHFERSIQLRWGARNHDYTAMVYWYSGVPVRSFHKIPPIEKRLPGSVVRWGEFDLLPPVSGEWRIIGPFPHNLIRKHRLDTGNGIGNVPARMELADSMVEKLADPHLRGTGPRFSFMGKDWKKVSAIRGFIDFNHFYRTAPSVSLIPTLEAVAVASCLLEVHRDTTAFLTLGWNDEIVLRVNEEEPLNLGTNLYFDSREIEIRLKAGANVITLAVSNWGRWTVTRGAWAFSFRAVTEEGESLRPVPW